jgi:hypothetical protein
MLRPAGPLCAFALFMTLVAGLDCRGGCSPTRNIRGPLDGTLAWFPVETQLLVSLDFRRLRRTVLGQRLPPLALSDAADRLRIDDFIARSGFDPFKQVDVVTIGFPAEARSSGQLGIVIRGAGMDESRLVAYARDQLAKDGDDLFSFRRSGRMLWAARKAPMTAAFFTRDGTLVLGAGGWAERMAQLSSEAEGAPPGPPRGAETNLELVHLVDRAGANRPLIAAAIVPAATRATLASDPTLSMAASVSRMALSMEGAEGTEVMLTADLATREQARDMVARIGQAIRNAKASPQLLLLGGGPYLDSVHAQASGVTCQISLHLSPGQTEDLVERLRALLTLARRGVVPGFPPP